MREALLAQWNMQLSFKIMVLVSGVLAPDTPWFREWPVNVLASCFCAFIGWGGGDVRWGYGDRGQDFTADSLIAVI